MSQDGRDTSDKASPDRKDAPAENGKETGDDKKKAAESTGGSGKSGPQTSKDSAKKVEPTAAGASGGTTAGAPTDKAADTAGKPAAAAAASGTASGTAKTAAAKSDAAKHAAGGSGAKTSDQGKAATKSGDDRKPAAATSSASKPAAARHASKKSGKRGGGGLSAILWTLVVIAVGVGVAVATLPRWQPAWNEAVGRNFPALRIAGDETDAGETAGGETATGSTGEVPPPEGDATTADTVDQRLADVESRLGDLAALDQRSQQMAAELDRALTRIEELEAGIKEVREVASQAAGQAGQSDASETLASINRRLDALEGGAGDGELEQSVQEVQSRLDELEQQTAEARTAAKDDSQALVLAVAQLRDSVRRGVSYADDLETLRKIADDDGEVASSLSQLEGHAATGVPTLAALSRRFDAIAGGLVNAAAASDDATWWGQAADRLGSLVTLRRKDGSVGGAEGAVAQAEKLLDQGDLKAAVDVLEGLSPELGGNARKVLGPWLEDANARLAAERALATLHVRAISRLGDAG